VTPPLDVGTSLYYSRPFRVIGASRFVAALGEEIEDAAVRAIVERVGWMGGVDQVTDNVGVLSNPARYRRLRALYE
jgi:hypothetical protein